MNMKLTNAALVTGLAMSFALAQTQSACAQFCRYEVTAIIQGPSCGLFGPAPLKVFGLNDLGQVCGEIEECALGPARFPFVWSEETGVVILPFPEGINTGRAVDINNVLGSDGLGQVVCQLSGPGVPSKGYLYDDGVWTLLPSALPTQTSEANALNDATQVTGRRTVIVDGELAGSAYRWEDGVFFDLLAMIGTSTSAIGRDINEFGDYVGSFGNTASNSVGFLWEAGIVTEIPALPGGFASVAHGVNEGSTVVGRTRFPLDNPFQVPLLAWVFHFGKQTPFPDPDDFNQTWGQDINEAGQILVLGSDTDKEGVGLSRAYLWQNGEIVDVRALYEPVEDLSFGGGLVAAINNRGQIAGTGSVSGEGLAGVILTPIGRPLGDVNIDCEVDADDLSLILQNWGPCNGIGSCIADVVTSRTFQPPPDGVVDGADLAVVLGNWTDRAKAPAANGRR